MFWFVFSINYCPGGSGNGRLIYIVFFLLWSFITFKKLNYGGTKQKGIQKLFFSLREPVAYLLPEMIHDGSKVSMKIVYHLNGKTNMNSVFEIN